MLGHERRTDLFRILLGCLLVSLWLMLAIVPVRDLVAGRRDFPRFEEPEASSQCTARLLYFWYFIKDEGLESRLLWGKVLYFNVLQQNSACLMYAKDMRPASLL